MKKVLVASFQRSGTHFLINTLASNFAGIADGWIDVVHAEDNKWVKGLTADNLCEKIREQLIDIYPEHELQQCVKTHFQAYFFERFWDELCERYHIIYIVRDPRDTIAACYNYYNKTNYEVFVREADFSKFLRAELWDVRTETQPYSYSYVKPRDIIDKWQKHLISWLPYRDRGVTFVHFSDLKNDLEGVIKKIESQTSLRRKSADLTEVTIEDSRYRPDFKDSDLSRGLIGAWCDYFKLEDLDFVECRLLQEVKQLAWRDDGA